MVVRVVLATQRDTKGDLGRKVLYIGQPCKPYAISRLQSDVGLYNLK